MEAHAIDNPQLHYSKGGNTNVPKIKKTIRVPVQEQYTNLQRACRDVVTLLKRNGINIPEAKIQTIGLWAPRR